MRLTFRVVLASLRSVEASFAEVASALRGTAYWESAIKAIRALSVARSEIYNILDHMIDNDSDL